MGKALILLTSFGLLVLSTLGIDTLLLLKDDACLDAPPNEIAPNGELETLETGSRSIEVTFDTFATVARVATDIATYTARVGSEPSSPLLDRLVRNKPSIWGNKSFYILLGVLYLTLLCLFLRQIISPLGPSSDVHDEFTHNSRQSH